MIADLRVGAFWGVVLGTAALGVLWAPGVGAEPARVPSGDADVKGQQRYWTGLALLNQGKREEALREFRSAYARSPSPALQYNIAIVLITLERHREAHQALAEYLAVAKGTLSEEERRSVVAQLDHLESYLGSIAIDARGSIGFEIDGITVERQARGDKVHLEPGSHRVTVRFRDGTVQERQVTVTAGVHQVLAFVLPVTSTPIRTEPRKDAVAHDPAPARAFPTVPWLITTVLVAGATTTGVLTLVRRGEEERIQAERGVDRRRLDEARSAVSQMALATDVLLSLSLAGVAVSTYLTIDWSRHRDRVPVRTEVRPGPQSLFLRTVF